MVPDAADERSLLDREEDEGAVYLKITSIKPILHEGETAVQVRNRMNVFVGYSIQVLWIPTDILTTHRKPPPTQAASNGSSSTGAGGQGSNPGGGGEMGVDRFYYSVPFTTRVRWGGVCVVCVH